MISFIIPLVTKKGGWLHKKSGWIYTFAMVFVATSAFVLTPYRFFVDPRRTNSSRGFSAFLFFIAVFTSASLWFGLQAVKLKSRKVSNTSLLCVGPPILLIVSGVSITYYGVVSSSKLLTYFPLLGIYVGWTQLQFWYFPPNAPKGVVFCTHVWIVQRVYLHSDRIHCNRIANTATCTGSALPSLSIGVSVACTQRSASADIDILDEILS